MTVLLALIACSLAASIGITYWTGLLAVESNRRLATQRTVIVRLERVVSTLKDAESAHRGYLLTGEERYLQPYESARKDLNSKLSDLRRLVVSGALPQDRVQEISDLVDKKLAEMEETIRLRREQGLEGALPRVRQGLGRELMTAIQAEAAKLENRKELEYNSAARRAETAATVRTVTFIGTAFLNLAFLGWVGGRITKTMDQREAAIAQSERQTEFLATTLASIGDGVIVTDPKGRITFLNTEAERLTGWREGEAFGAPLTTVFRIVNEDSRQPMQNPGEQALRMGMAVGLVGRALLLSKDGRETPVGDSSAPVRRHGGPVLGVVLVFRDITEQRTAQEARERLAAIVESSQDAVFSTSLDGKIRTWNIGARRMFGYEPEEIIGKKSTLLLTPDRLGEEEGNLQRLKRGGRIAALETVRLTRDGRSFDASVTISPLKSDDGRTVGVSQIVRDITERKRAQLELQRLNTELEKRVTERTRSLQEATEQLNAFCYSVAHDLQAPLRAQLAFAQVLLEDFGPALGSEGREYIDRIAQSADRQGRLVRDLLAHVSLSRTELPLEPVELAKAVHKVRMDLSADIENQKATLKLGPLTGNVLANPSSLHLIISNLVSNALKFVPPGAQPKVRIWTEAGNGSVRLWVEDKGIGIPAKHMGKLFGVFQRLHTIDQYPGTGIGLAIVKKAAERMSGAVGVESEPGVGSRFWVDLRAATPAVPKPAKTVEKVA